jgi:hypothetical protein
VPPNLQWPIPIPDRTGHMHLALPKIHHICAISVSTVSVFISLVLTPCAKRSELMKANGAVSVTAGENLGELRIRS